MQKKQFSIVSLFQMQNTEQFT